MITKTMGSNLTGEKSAVESVGVWGSLIALIPAAYELVTQAAQNGSFGPHATAILTAVGAALSLYGRLTAKKKITSIVPAS